MQAPQLMQVSVIFTAILAPFSWFEKILQKTEGEVKINGEKKRRRGEMLLLGERRGEGVNLEKDEQGSK
jgi:hypothetical protein